MPKGLREITLRYLGAEMNFISSCFVCTWLIYERYFCSNFQYLILVMLNIVDTKHNTRNISVTDNLSK